MSLTPTLLNSLDTLDSVVIECELCSRLRRYCLQVSRKKRRQFMDWEYWGKPIPGFGDPLAQLMILGLAPAAHGGNRTGRMFTGDGSAQFLMAALHQFGLATKSTSESKSDGLRLHNAYMTAIVRCAPPGNKPKPSEIANCKYYWTQELRLLPNVRVVLALGRIVFDTYVRFLREQGIQTGKLKFQHGAFYELPKPHPALCASYHPSRQNTQTGKLTLKMFTQMLNNVSFFLVAENSNAQR
jgi:uracil-DNA glycosylase